MFKAIIIAGTLLFAAPALAQHAHSAQKGPNGGPMEDVAGVHVELVVSGQALAVNVFDEAGKPVETKGYTSSALVVVGADRKTIALAPSGTALTAQSPTAIPSGAAITLVVKTAAGKSGQAKFSAP